MQQFQTVHGAVQAQLGAAEAREAALGREQEIMQGALTGQVAGVMDMMKGLRVSLSTKLSESQSVCQALAQELAAQKAKNSAFERCCSGALLSVQLLRNYETPSQLVGLGRVQSTLHWAQQTTGLHEQQQAAQSHQMMDDMELARSHSAAECAREVLMLVHTSAVFGVCRGLIAGGAYAATSGVSSGGASNSGSASFLAYTPNSTLAITGASTTPHSVSGSVAGPLALTPVRRMELPQQGMLCTDCNLLLSWQCVLLSSLATNSTAWTNSIICNHLSTGRDAAACFACCAGWQLSDTQAGACLSGCIPSGFISSWWKTSTC